MSIHEPPKEFSVRGVSRDADGPDIRAFAEVQNEIITFLRRPLMPFFQSPPPAGCKISCTTNDARA